MPDDGRDVAGGQAGHGGDDLGFGQPAGQGQRPAEADRLGDRGEKVVDAGDADRREHRLDVFCGVRRVVHRVLLPCAPARVSSRAPCRRYDAAARPRGTKGGRVTVTGTRLPRTSTVSIVPGADALAATNPRAIPRRSVGEKLPLVTWPTSGPPGSAVWIAWPARGIPGPSTLRPTSFRPGPAARIGSRAVLPRKSGLFQSTAQDMAASTGLMSTDSSWPCSG